MRPNPGTVDPDLTRLVAVWQDLPKGIIRAICALIDFAMDETG